MQPDQTELRRLFDYAPQSGTVTRKVCTCPRHVIGEVVGHASGNGYLQTTVGGKKEYVHRLIWCWLYGDWPTKAIDHINRKRSDNRKYNLRLATRAQNAQNATMSRRNTSGFRGVSWDKRNRTWVATIRANGKNIRLGRYPSPDQASDAYQAAKTIYHPTAQAT